MNALKQPGWLRGLEIVTGLLAILFGVIVFAFPGLGVATLVVVLSIGLIFAGIRSISIVGFSRLSKGLRIVSAIAGIVSLILAIIVTLFPGYGALTLMILLAYGLIVYGFSRIFLAYTLKSADGWLRGVIAAVGVLDVILSFVVIALPGLGLLTLTVILSLVLLVSGAEILISGATGRTWLGNLVKAVSDENKELEGKR